MKCTLKKLQELPPLKIEIPKPSFFLESPSDIIGKIDDSPILAF